jgi:fucose 4-O-acetylase-like acetyltransferase
MTTTTLSSADRKPDRLSLTAPTRGVTTRPGRDPLLDNARLVLICMVVLAHIIRLNLFDHLWSRALYSWMIIFLMPAFAAIAGHLSSATITKRGVWDLVTRLVAPYAVFELLYWWLKGIDPSTRSDIDLLTPTWLLWFLVALFLWRVSLPLLLKTRHPLLVAVLIGLAAGFLPSPVYTLSLTRSLILYPFFVMGYCVSRNRITLMKTHPLLNVAVLSFAAVFAALFCTGAGEAWLHGTQPYTDMGVAPFAGAAVRVGHYLGGALVVGSFLALIPDWRMALSHLGSRTLYPYLLHGAVLLALRPFVEMPASPMASVALLAAGVSLALALSTRPVMRGTRILVEPASALGGVAQKLIELRGESSLDPAQALE